MPVPAGALPCAAIIGVRLCACRMSRQLCFSWAIIHGNGLKIATS
jgi:hypothetical protein